MLSGPLLQRFPASLSRRAFVRNLVGLVGAAMGSTPLRLLAQTPNPSAPIHVIVVGAGLAGLVAAYELEKRGHRVTLLEAERRHIGGRVRTLRFDAGLHGEAGAMRVPTRHEITRAYLREFGLPLSKFVYSNPDAWLYVRGQRERVRDVAKLFPRFALRDDERGKTVDDFWNAAIGRTMASLGADEKADLVADAPKSERFAALDRLSLHQLCRDAGLSDEAIELIMVTSGSESLLPFAATESLREELLEVWTQGFDEIVGGTDRFATAFVARLQSKPRLGCEVVRLTQDVAARRAAAIYREGVAMRRVEGDFLLCTAPCPVLTRIDVDPAFSPAKTRAIREISYDSATKVLAVANRRFWESDDGIFGGGTFTDLPIVSSYYPSDNAEARDPRVSRGPGVLLASYSWGQPARRLAMLSHRDRVADTLRHLSRIHPQVAARGVIRHTASFSWDNHRYAGGAFVLFHAGQHSALHKAIVAPEGRIHFAGEHVSLAHSWMQGALESGVRATREMLEAALRG